MPKSLLILTILALLLVLPGLTGAYTIKPGDTISSLAKKFGLSQEELLRYNPDITDPDRIYAGDSLKLPTRSDPQKKKSGHSVHIHSLSEQDKELLARVVHAEAKGEPYEGKVAVAHVVLNRVEHEAFPDTVREVIFQPRQFQPVTNGAIWQPPDQESIRAVEEALETHGEDPGSLYFYNPRTSTDRWIFSRDIVEVIGNHVFAK